MAARGDHAGVERLARPWASRPGAAPALQAAWANALLALGHTALALQVWQQLAQRSPTPPMFTGLGRALLAADQPARALTPLLRALSQSPQSPTRAFRSAALAAPASPEVIQAVAMAAHLRPSDLPLGLVHARVLEASGRLDDAAQALSRVQARHPQHPEPPLRLASLLAAVGQLDAAARHAHHACTLLPRHTEPWRVAAFIARKQGNLDRAAELLDRALAVDPHHPGLQWARAILVPAIPDSPEAEAAAVADYDARLEALHELADRTLPADAQRWLHAVQDAFPVHYVGGDCLQRQHRHGLLVTRIVQAALPVPAPSPPPRTRMRVGFVSSVFRRHTVTKLFQRWMTHLDRARFEVVGYHTGLIEDDTTRALRAACDGWHTIAGPLPTAVHTIVRDAPDALIFPELGMDARVLTLAAVRLAPKQAVTWGHPITTGLPSIDTFLACEAMGVAPDRTWTHEARVDLPGIGVHYDRPPIPIARPRAHFDLPDSRPLLLCVQSLQKYRPAHDALYARIAARVPHALLVFVADPGTARTERLRARFRRTFAAAGLELDHHLTFLPRLSEPDWMSLLAIGDLFLDSPEWSGGNTTLEAVSVGLPCIAWPGHTFRGRHCLGINQALGRPDLCPRTPDDWVDLVVQLAHDAPRRAILSQEIRAAAPGLFHDNRSTEALADWLRSPA